MPEPANQPKNEDERPLTVLQITSQIRRLLESTFRSVYVIGEVSDPRLHQQSGNLYFSLKDQSALIKAVSWKHERKNLGFEVKHGDQVRIRGTLAVYMPNGQYQIVVQDIEPAGAGNLHQQLEQLKRKLRDEGLFDETRRKELPLLPRKIGVVTSRSGAAVHDFISVIKRRFPNIHLLVYPVLVEGANAAKEIATAVHKLNQGTTIDVIVVTRGGGSFEALFPFSSEVVVRTIAASRLPVISAVGHKTDTPLCELVADKVAATPSIAAELLVGRKDAFLEQLAATANDLTRTLNRSVLEQRNRFERLKLHPVFHEPARVVQHHRQAIERHQSALRLALKEQAGHHRLELRDLRHHLTRLSSDALHSARQRLDDGATRQLHAMETQRSERRRQLERLQAQLRALSPFNVLERGFSITRLPDGRVVRDAAALAPGDKIITRLHQGEVESTVEDTKPA